MKCKLAWVKPYEPEEFSGDTRWILNAYPVDGKEWEKFQNSGLQQIPKEDANGEKFIRFRRSVRKVFPKDDEATYWNPPEISGEVEVHYIDEESGEKVKSFKRSEKRIIKTVGEQKLIGNGSEGIINLAVYDSGKGKGHRWESLKVTKLIEYDPDNNKKQDDQKPVVIEDIPAVPVEKAPKKGKEPTVVKEEMNDDIPW